MARSFLLINTYKGLARAASKRDNAQDHAGRNSKCQAQSGSISSNHQANWASLRSSEYHKHRKLERAQWRKFEKAKAQAAKDTKEEEENKCRPWYALHQPQRDAHRWELAAATARSSASSATART